MDVLKGHTENVLALTFNADGSKLASSSFDNTVRLWDVTTGKTLHTLTGSTERTVALRFSPDGAILAAGSVDKTITLWDVKTGEKTGILKGHTATVLTVAFSPDGKVLASGGLDRTIKLWDVATGNELTTLRAFSLAEVRLVAFTPDGKLLASAGKGIKIWDVATRKEIPLLEGQIESAISVAFSPDGKELAAGDQDGKLRHWDMTTGKEKPTLNPNEGVQFDGKSKFTHGGLLRLARFLGYSADGKLLVAVWTDGSADAWNLATGKKRVISTGTPRPLAGYSPAITPAPAIKPDLRVLALPAGYRIKLQTIPDDEPGK